MRRFGIVVAAICAMLFAAPAFAAGFSDWAAIVVAGDWHSHSGAPSEVFDNGRRDVAANLAALGFSQSNIIQFSVRADTHPGTEPSTKQVIANDLWDLSNRTTGGCFIYFTSHGSPDGIVLGEGLLSPSAMSAMIDNACGSRPTVVFVVACFSGVFVRELSGPNRFVMTAARPDRTSFGCGDNDRYTFFDACWLGSIGGSGDFGTLANSIRACVTRKEQEIQAYPSEPQVSVGPTMAAAIPRWR
ncbi:MAG: peptidase C13 [Alphaproteobacteria bacterium]|nr:peptidase C13 [Alphaproteobacteria bacterium]